MLLVSRSPKPLAMCMANAAVAAAPSGVGVPADWDAACERRRSFSISLAANPGLKPLLEADVGIGPGIGHDFVSMTELAVDVDSTSKSTLRSTPSFSPMTNASQMASVLMAATMLMQILVTCP